MPSPTKKKDEEYSWITYLKKRIKDNKNFLGMISGPTGSGKSWSGLSIGEMLDNEFDEVHVVFSGLELLKLVNSDKLRVGSVIIWDEAGIDHSSRTWQSKTNRLLNFLFQTFRHKNYIVFFTAPYTTFIDSATRRLFHAHFETAGINPKTKKCAMRCKLIQYNQKLNKIYEHHLKIMLPGRRKAIKVKRWLIPKPSDGLIKKYERKRERFTARLNKDLEQEMTAIGEKKEKQRRRPMKQGVEIQCKTCKKIFKGTTIRQAESRFNPHVGSCIEKNKDYKHPPTYQVLSSTPKPKPT